MDDKKDDNSSSENSGSNNGSSQTDGGIPLRDTNTNIDKTERE